MIWFRTTRCTTRVRVRWTTGASTCRRGRGVKYWISGLALGPARYIADRTGADVTALELQADLNASGIELTERCGLQARVSHVAGDFLSGIVPAGQFGGILRSARECSRPGAGYSSTTTWRAPS